jgi:hypothetical protein
VFSSAFLAFTTPVWRSARTLVVPPGVKLYRLLGEGSGCELGLDAEDGSDQSGFPVESRTGGREVEVERLPSSVSARALPFPVSINFGMRVMTVVRTY